MPNLILQDDVFPLTIGGENSTEKIIQEVGFGWRSRIINGKNFPYRKGPLEDVEIRLARFSGIVTSEEVLEGARENKLTMPTYESALLFAKHYPEEQKKGRIVFLHDPWINPYGLSKIIVLDGDQMERFLFSANFRDFWKTSCRFAFFQKQKK